MKLRIRRTPRLFMPVGLPAIGLSLLTLAGGHAQAQESQAVTGIEAPFVPTVPLTNLPAADPQAAQAAQPAQANGQTIGEIVVVGNKTLATSAIITLSGHKVGDPCDTQTLTDMRDHLTKTGNFGMHHPDQQDQWVRVQAENIPNTTKCKVTITVDENDKINSITITGSGPIKPDDVKKLIKPGAVYNLEDVSRDVQSIIDLYNKQGYSIEFGSDLGMDINNPGVLVIPIIVTRVDDIVIDPSKKHKTRDYVIFREMKTKKGDYYNRNTFYQRDRDHLINLELFDEVAFSETPVGVGRVRLTISVVEKRTGSISAGVGYSNREQLIGQAEVSETNFGGRGESISLLARTGGAAGRSSIELGYTRPWLDKKQTAMQISVFDKTVYRFSNSLQNSVQTSTGPLGTDNRYNEQRTGGTVTLSRPLRETVFGTLTLRGENVRTDPLALSGVNAEIIQNGPIYSLGGALFHDNRDIKPDPVAGGYQNVSLQVGHANLRRLLDINGNPVPQSVTGSANFSKASVEFRQYLSLQGRRKPLRNGGYEEKRSLAFRFLLGSSVGTLPFFEQFFVGGAESLRGYREDRYWGKYMFLGSVELRQPLARRLKGVLFLDIGDAWGGSYSNVNIVGFRQSGFKPHLGIGLGIRVGTPLGPIRLDYGIGDEGGRTNFSIGNSF